jgi:hypothetical protein
LIRWDLEPAAGYHEDTKITNQTIDTEITRKSIRRGRPAEPALAVAAVSRRRVESLCDL